MKRFSLSADLEATLDGEVLSLAGELNRGNGVLLEQWLMNPPYISELNLAELDIEDGVAATHAVNTIRLLCLRVPQLRLVASPQLLAHTLYRTGMLAAGGIELVAMREEEPYG